MDEKQKRRDVMVGNFILATKGRKGKGGGQEVKKGGRKRGGSTTCTWTWNHSDAEEIKKEYL